MHPLSVCRFGVWCLLVFHACQDTEAIQASLYRGCFKYSSGKEKPEVIAELFPGRYFNTSNMNAERCLNECKKGFDFAGYTLGHICYCSNKKPDTTRRINDDDCGLVCSSDGSKRATEPRIMIYATGTPRPDQTDTEAVLAETYRGCFRYSGEIEESEAIAEFFNGKHLTSSNMNVQLCIKDCRINEFNMAGMTLGRVCYCSNWRPSNSRKVADSECGMRCGGDGSRMAIYATKLPGQDQTVSPFGTTASVLPPRPPSPRPTTTEFPNLITQPSPPPTPHSPNPSVSCKQSTTTVNGKRACRNSVIFYEDFSQIDLSNWSYEIKIAKKPDYEFTVFDAKPENSFIRDGALHIQPTFYDDEFIKTGSIQLDSCTGEVQNGECAATSDNYILPPTQSARIDTRETFSFKYGVVEIQAKVPLGDWIVSEMWLVPTDNSYGAYYESGKIKMTTRGNRYLKFPDGSEMGTQTVEGSVMIGYGDDVKSKSVTFTRESGWHDEFHNFTIIWTPDDIAFSVDGMKRRNIMLNSRGRLSDVIGFQSSQIQIWSGGTTLAPFDQSFSISLGVSVGGRRDFPNNAKSNGYAKPWSDTDPKAPLKFWNRRNEWQRTWEGETAFQIKSVKVTAL